MLSYKDNPTLLYIFMVYNTENALILLANKN